MARRKNASFTSVVREILNEAGQVPSILDAPGTASLAHATVGGQATEPGVDPKAKKVNSEPNLSDGVTKNQGEEAEEDSDDDELDDYFMDDEEEEDDDEPKAKSDSEEEEDEDDSDEEEEDEDAPKAKSDSEEEEDDEDEPKSEEEEDEDAPKAKSDSEEEEDDEDEPKSEEEEDDDDMEPSEDEEDTFEVDDKLVSDAVTQMFKGQKINEEFAGKARTIAETYLRTAARQIHTKVDKIVKDRYTKRLHENLNKTRTKLVEQLDTYLDYVVEEWMNENRLAVENGVRAEIAENFLQNLHRVFAESYIDVPESKINLVEELTKKCETLKERNQTAIQTAVRFKKLYEESRKTQIVEAASADFSSNRKAKLTKLAENVSYETLAEFEEKVSSLAESVAASKKPRKADDNFEFGRKETIMESKESREIADPNVRQAVAALDRLSKS